MSASNTSSGVSIGSVTSGISSAVSHEVRLQGRLVDSATARKMGLWEYALGLQRPGDIYFHTGDGGAGHANMIAPDKAFKVDSVDPHGVRKIPYVKDKWAGLVYRFRNVQVALQAARLAESWAGRVKYSDAAGGTGITFRTFAALFGSSHFGLGAHARLLKYRSRGEFGAPKNVICSEMCILAYQLVMTESSPGFIKLDAKYSTPSTLMSYFDGPGQQSGWQRVALKPGEKP